jgi:hypothetical protein
MKTPVDFLREEAARCRRRAEEYAHTIAEYEDELAGKKARMAMFTAEAATFESAAKVLEAIGA